MHTAPFGVVTGESGTFVRFVVSAPEAEMLGGDTTPLPAPPALWDGDFFGHSLGDPNMYGLGDGTVYCDSDCGHHGCWCGVARAAGTETFHCAECIQPYDIGYTCAVYPRLCVGCCGHAHCQILWDHLLSRTPL